MPITTVSDGTESNEQEYVLYRIWCGISIFISTILCVAFVGFSGMHLSMHFYQMSLNLTSIEYATFSRLQATGAHMGLKMPLTHKYDYGNRYTVCTALCCTHICMSRMRVIVIVIVTVIYVIIVCN